MNKREFTFSDGKSDKFWNIEVDGDGFTVNYGRSGTAGQTQAKSFDDATAAQTAADKLIAEKLKKGYVEAGSGAVPTSSTASEPAPGVKATPQATLQPEPKAKTEESDSPLDQSEPEALSEPAPIQQNWSGSSERQLRLEPRDWLWATWRPWTPELRDDSVPQPFDKENALQRLAKVPGNSYWITNWDKAAITPNISHEEAHFWLVAMTKAHKYTSGGYQSVFRFQVVAPLENQEFDGKIDKSSVVKLFQKSPVQKDSLLWRVLRNLFSPLEIFELMLEIDGALRDKKQQHADSGLGEDACYGFRREILPYLQPDEREQMKSLLKKEIDPAEWPSGYYGTPNIAFFLAAQLGLHEELSAVVRCWKDDLYSGPDSGWHDHYHRPQEIVFGLGSAAEVEREMRRLRLRLNKPHYIRAWLAHTEFSAPDVVRDSILSATGENYRTAAKDVAAILTENFALAEAPEIAPHMLQLMLESRAPRQARQWLDEHPHHAVTGLLPTAAGRGKLAEAAIDYLRSLKKRGGEATLREAAHHLSEEERARVQASILDYTEKQCEPFADTDAPEAVRAALAEAPKSQPKGSWIQGVDLPPITYGDRRLSDGQIERLLGALRKSDHAYTVAVKGSADAPSLDAFTWKLFERWLSEGAPSKEKWAMLALGQLGGDASALKLTPLIRAWPGESQHQRAVTGLECLRAIGSDTALMQINGIAQKVKFKGLQGKAIEAMEGIASDRGLSRAQLEDRVVPTLDLDEKGTRIFDFGPRQFRFVLSPEMKPMVREEDATMTKPRPDLPKPTSKDDAAKSEAAIAEWKLLKKQIAELVKIQVVRLENAMVKGRRWTVEEFEMLLARHPLMTNLVRLLVWEAASGNQRATFRVVEDGSYADQNDQDFDLAAGEWAHIGIVHPLNLSEAEKSAWGEIFSDYELVPPFAQLGRPTYALEEGEVQLKELTRFKNTEIHPQTLCFGLEKLGWERGPALDGGGFYEHYKYFEASNVTACVVYEPGLYMGGQEWWEPQKVTESYFVENRRSKHEGRYWDYPDKTKAVALSEVDAVAVSEVLKDLSELAAKGTEK